MNDAQTLKEVIALGIERGYKEPNGNKLEVDDKAEIFCFVNDSSIRAYGYQFGVEKLLLSHEFARCYFGEEPRVIIGNADDSDPNDIALFQYHLQQLVLLPTDSERIAYYWNNRGEK